MALLEPASDSVRRSVFDALPDGIVIVDLDGRIAYVNEQLRALSGYTSAELVGRTIDELVPDAQRAQHHAHRESYISAGLPTRSMGSLLRIRLRTKQNVEVPVDIALRSVETDGRVQVLAAIREATERTRAQGRIAGLLEISQRILRSDPPDEVLVLIARLAHELIGADFATIAIPTRDHTELVIEVADGVAADQLRNRRMAVGQSLAGAVFLSGESLVVADAAADERSAQDNAREVGYGACIVVPLNVAGSVFGALMVANLKSRGVFGEGDLRVVELFANQAAVALEYSRVRDELRRLAIVEDRERIGRELHDGVIQALFAVGMNLQASAIIAGPGELRERLEAAVTELDGAIGDLRNYIFGLRPGILADRQLGRAIALLAADTEEQSGITVAVEVDAALAAALSELAGDIVQLVRESLSNVARHSGAATCRVSLLRKDGTAMLVIEDDGSGFDDGVPTEGQGLGNLRDRSARLGGTATITSGGDGTRVEIKLAIPK
ncbi:MAG: PAS domain S-box protein [Candidatus Dormibacteraeota bacterium]|nr:PAS domain S-box protein [Candidatus Dormibacteraeota bacterium]